MIILHFFLGLIYILLPIVFVLYYRIYYLEKEEDKYFFLWGFVLKMFGAVSAVLIYTQYYSSGDTLYYFQAGSKLLDFLLDHPNAFFDIFLSPNLSKYENLDFIYYKQGLVYYRDTSSYTVSKISILLNFLSFQSFLLTSILCSYFSFFCSWKFYKFISKKVDFEKMKIGYAIFFMPSVIFWGSGLFKDTFTLAALYLLMIAMVNIFGYKKISPSYLIYIVLSLYLLISIRSFFLLTIFPFISMWVMLLNYRKIASPAIRFFLVPVFILFILGGSFFILKSLTQTFQELSFENLADKSKGFQSWHTTLKGSAYSLGDMDYSLQGIVNKIPAAINVSLFRPYLWEANKAIILLSAIQSLIFLIFTFYVLMKLKFIYFFKHLFRSPGALSLLGFSLFYAFIVGFTSYNFGALDRYKIPCLSAYIISLLFVLDDYYKELSQN